jgi:AraC-like DNA-binding protein
VLARRSPAALTLEALAREVGASVFHLCRAFRRTHGETIHRYLVRLRVRRALELIAHEALNLTTLAMELDFAHHSHFTSAFGREFGAPPSVVRAELRVRAAARASRS